MAQKQSNMRQSTILFKPDVYNVVEKLAYREHTSISEMVNRLTFMGLKEFDDVCLDDNESLYIK